MRKSQLATLFMTCSTFAWLAPTDGRAQTSGAVVSAIDADWSPSRNKAAAKALMPLLEGRNIPAISGLSPSVARKFWAASSLLTRNGPYPQINLFAYDYITRCALSTSFNTTRGITGDQNMLWFRPTTNNRPITVPSMAFDSILAIGGFAQGLSLKIASDCVERINIVYGALPVRGSEKLAQHTEIVLRGGPAGSAQAPLEAGALTRTALSRIAASAAIEAPQLLAVIADKNSTVVLIGDPQGGTRFAAQYRNLEDGKWQFEGASSLGLALVKELAQ
ncbi:MAG: hypothetical protein JWO15_2985 [Sphingomonadales bacterium]|nr:hypothetical protein [Sphingomonadales bacterium]